MLALALCLVAFTGLSVVCKLAQIRGASLRGFNLVLFGTCAAGSVAWTSVTQRWDGFDPVFWTVSLTSGALALLAVVALLKALAAGAFATSNAVVRSSVVIPAAAGMLIFDERLGGARMAGFAAVLGSFALAGMKPSKGGTATGGAGWLLWVSICWVANGLSQGTQVWVAKTYPNGELCYLAAFYGGGLALAVALTALRSQRVERADWIYGALGAICSLLGMAATMSALASMDAAVVVPVSIAGAMVLIVLVGRYVFGERLAAKDWAIVVLASAGSVLLAVS